MVRIIQAGGRQALPKPLITEPRDAQVVNTGAVTVSWTAVPGATGYMITVSDIECCPDHRRQHLVAFADGAALSTVISVPHRQFQLGVRACAGGWADGSCGPFAESTFTVQAPFSGRPTGVPALDPVAPSGSSVLLSWGAVTGAEYYGLELDLFSSRDTVINNLRMRVNAPATGTVFALPSAHYGGRLYACNTLGCGPPAYINFFRLHGSVPTMAPVIARADVSNGNQLDVRWNAVPGADLYQVQVIQPGAGPGGGALTVAARQVGEPETRMFIPAGPATVLVAACHGDGCGPLSLGRTVNAPGPNPAGPVIGTPMSGVLISGPNYFFTWSRAPGDNGSNTNYRLYVADLSTNSAAADVFTRNNFATVHLAAGRRFDAVVVANPGTPLQAQGPASTFLSPGGTALAPTVVSPAHGAEAPQGKVRLTWAYPRQYFSMSEWDWPSYGWQYQYYVAPVAGGGPVFTGPAQGNFVELPLPAIGGRPTVYTAIMRACFDQSFRCDPGSNDFWGPWSNTPGGPGVTNFTVLP